MILNYATFLEEHKYFEDSFRAYEKGIAVFDFPHVREIWIAYLRKFVERYQETKIERARDLFEVSFLHPMSAKHQLDSSRRTAYKFCCCKR